MWLTSLSPLRPLRAVMARALPDSWKVPPPCPPAALASSLDRLDPVAVGLGALILLLAGAEDALSLESVFGSTFAAVYLSTLVVFAVLAIGAKCILTLGQLLRVWGVFVVLLASSALALKLDRALMPVVFYLLVGFHAALRGNQLVRLSREFCRART